MKRTSSLFLTGITGILVNVVTVLLVSQRVDAVFLDHLSQDIRGTNSSAVWRWARGPIPMFHLFLRYLIAYKNLLRSIENIGIAVVYGIRQVYFILKKRKNFLYFRYYAQGNISQDQYIQVSCNFSLSYLNFPKTTLV